MSEENVKRIFGGKIFAGKDINPSNRMEANFEKAHYKAYSRGYKIFTFGTKIDSLGRKVPAEWAVKEYWVREKPTTDGTD